MKYLILLLLIASCGKRTTSNQSTYFKSDSLSVENSRILSQNIKLNDIYTLEPFDSNKPMIIDGKYYYNAVIKYDKSKFEDFKIEESEKAISNKSESGTSNKETIKTDYSNTILGSIFIVCLFVFLWLKFK